MQKSELSYETIAQIAPVGICYSNLQGECQYVNDRWCDWSGLTPQQAKGASWLRVIHPSDRHLVSAAWRQFTLQQISFSCECRLQSCATQLLAQATAVIAEGKITGYVVTLTLTQHNYPAVSEYETVDAAIQPDISEHQHSEAKRQQVESDLREKEEQLRLALEFSQVGMWDWQIPSDRLIWNPNTAQLFGLLPQNCEVGVQSWLDRIHSQDRDRVWKAITAAIENHSLYEAEYRVFWDNDIHWILARGRALYDDANQPLRMVGIVIDISERKQIEEALQKSEARLSLTLSGAKAGIWEWNEITKQEFWSDEIYYLLGYEPGIEEPSYNLWFSAIHPDDQERVRHYNQSFSDKQKTSIALEYRVLLPDGTVRWLYSIGEVTYDERGNLLRRSGIQIDITDRKQVEAEHQQAAAALLESQSLYKSLADVLPLALFRKDREDRFTFINTAFLNLMGRSLSECLGKTTHDFNPQDLAEQYQADDRRVFETGEIIDLVEMIEIPATGERRYFQTMKAPVRDADGQVIEVQGIFWDITDRQLAAANLRRSEERFQAFMDNSPTVAFIKDEAGRLVYANANFETLFGRSPSDFNITAFDDMPAEIAEQFQFQDRQVLTTGQPIEVTETLPDAEGNPRDWLSFKFPLSGINGQQLLGCVAIDITERKRSEAALQEMSSALSNTVEGISRIDLQGCYLSANQAYSGIIGYLPEEMVGMDWRQTVHPDDLERAIAAYRQMLSQGKVEVELRGIRKNGSVFYKQIVMVAAYDKAQQFVGHHCFLRDISDRKQTELELEKAKEAALREAVRSAEASRAKSDFLSRMSHELRTPLTAILGFAELVAADPSLSQENQENLDIIIQSGQHLLNMINDVLQMSKIEAGELTLDETSFDLHSLLENLGKMLQLKAHSKNLRLTLDRAIDVPQHIQTDENKIRQVLINLLDNAIKFTNEGNVTLRISRREPDSQSAAHFSALLDFAVQDTGSGIAPAEISSLFDAFAQTQTGRQLQEGTGLGLAISQQFVRLMGGNITVQSQIGQGTTFTFTIPVAVEDDRPLQSPILYLSDAQPVYRILIVDDSWQLRKIISRLLTPLGFEMREAGNGQEAIAIWESWQPHLIWMDMQMPGVDGYEATRQIRILETLQARAAQHTVVIALTAGTFEEQRVLALTAGCNDFVAKPFQKNIILEKIAEHLGLHYRYEHPVGAQASPAPDTQLRLESTALQVMPPEWIANLHTVAAQLSTHQCLSLLEQIPEAHDRLKQKLTDLVNSFRFDTILDLSQPLEHEP